MGWKYTEEILRGAVAQSESMAGVLRQLGVVQSGGNHAHISRAVKKLGIDTSHFTGQAWRRGKPSERRRRPEELLVRRSPGSARVGGDKLRRALLAMGRAYACEACDNEGRWRGAVLTLHVDHVSGEYYDNRPENLRFLCPNCHAVTPTFAGRHRARREQVPTSVPEGGLEPPRP